jgi:hypothetical protein
MQFDGVPERALHFSDNDGGHQEQQAHPERHRQRRKDRAAFVASQIAESHFEDLDH